MVSLAIPLCLMVNHLTLASDSLPSIFGLPLALSSPVTLPGSFVAFCATRAYLCITTLAIGSSYTPRSCPCMIFLGHPYASKLLTVSCLPSCFPRTGLTGLSRTSMPIYLQLACHRTVTHSLDTHIMFFAFGHTGPPFASCMT